MRGEKQEGKKDGNIHHLHFLGRQLLQGLSAPLYFSECTLVALQSPYCYIGKEATEEGLILSRPTGFPESGHHCEILTAHTDSARVRDNDSPYPTLAAAANPEKHRGRAREPDSRLVAALRIQLPPSGPRRPLLQPGQSTTRWHWATTPRGAGPRLIWIHSTLSGRAIAFTSCSPRLSITKTKTTADNRTDAAGRTLVLWRIVHRISKPG